MKTLSIATFCSAVFLVCGCRSFTSPARQHDIGAGVRWIDYDATRRGAYLITTNNPNVRILVEQSPDVAMGVVADFVAKGSYSGISAEASAKVTETIAELGKRTQTVMVLREALYRVNELQLIRPDISAQDTKELYEEILKTTLAIAQADLESAKAEPAKAAATEAVARVAKVAEINKTIAALGETNALKILNIMGADK